MRELASKDAARGFSDAVSRAEYGRERIVLTRRGRRVAAIVPLADLDVLEHAPLNADSAISDRKGRSNE